MNYKNENSFFKLLSIEMNREVQLTQLPTISHIFNYLQDFQFIKNINLKNLLLETIEMGNISSTQIYDHTTLKELSKIQSAFRVLNLEISHCFFAFCSRLIGFQTRSIVKCNLYHSTKEHDGLRPHSDLKDNIVVQIAGKKKWIIGDKSQEYTLKPGDVLFIPNGIKHHAHALDDSMHVTFSFYPKNLLSLIFLTNRSHLYATETSHSLNINLSQSELADISRDYKNLIISERMRNSSFKGQKSDSCFLLNILGILFLEDSDNKITITYKQEMEIFELSLTENEKTIFKTIFSMIQFRPVDLVKMIPNISEKEIFAFINKLTKKDILLKQELNYVF